MDQDVFGPWEATRFEHGEGRVYLVMCKLLSTPSIVRFHRASSGAPIWYTEDGAKKKAEELNQKDAD